ncbi:MAG TPA: TonB-dependent receptor plug domain-containing protein, partial [Chitinophagaceae bacterium]|nr:TonB-dependent receptor plug domain-containing protein [Chitinophagaceae bacterium]
MFEQKIDRMIINVKNSITNAGGTALDVLEKSPGVTVNRQNNTIAINGKNGVAVMINGKITYISMDALVQLLENINASNIEKIELITTPPAKYDAEGNAGYINIVLINNPYAGFSGSYFLTAGYGYRELGAAGINFNYRSAKINLYGNYAFNHDHYIQPSIVFTQLTRAGNIVTNTSFSNRDAVRQVQNIRIGIDYQLDTATIIGALMSGYNSRWSMTANNGTTISKNNIPDTAISTVNREVNQWQNIMANLNFQHEFKPGKLLFFDVNYIYYEDNNPNTYSNTYYNNLKEFLYHEDLRSGKITPINL